jgi:hypothetical protein
LIEQQINILTCRIGIFSEAIYEKSNVMKKISAFLLAATLFSLATPGRAQESDTAVIRQAIESRNYIFEAQRVYPLTSSSRFLTPGYDLSVRGDTIISYLPFFGRAYSAPVNPAEGGIKFTSTSFKYSMKKQKNKWDVTIIPRDASDVQQMDLDIFDNGTATLRVTNTNRQPISFNGYIEKGKPKEKRAF